MTNRVAGTYAISADLTGEALDACFGLWSLLEDEFGLTGAQAAVRPHLTFVVGETREAAALHQVVHDLGAALTRLNVTFEGLGVFLGPVVFLQPKPDSALAAAQARIAAAAEAAGLRLWDYYRPRQWAPHVTLACHDVRDETLEAVLEALRRRPLAFQTRLETLDLVQVVHPRHVYLLRAHLQPNSP
jgi:2'-5' RNA ligase